MKGCIANTHWDACEFCRNYDESHGCIIKENIPLSLKDGKFIICDDYEENTQINEEQLSSSQTECLCGSCSNYRDNTFDN